MERESKGELMPSDSSSSNNNINNNIDSTTSNATNSIRQRHISND